MSDDKITAEALARMAAQLGVKPPKAGQPKPKFPVDIEVEEIVVGGTRHCRVHLVHYGYSERPMRGVSSNHTAGPELDALVAEAERLGFRVIHTKGRG